MAQQDFDRRNTRLDGVFRQVELRGELAPLGPRDVVLLDELLLEAPDLLSREGGPVPSDVVHVVVAPAAAAVLLLLRRVGGRHERQLGSWRRSFGDSRCRF